MTAVMSRAHVVYDASTQSFLQSQRYTVRVVDRISGGDSFAAGLIHGFVSGRDPDSTLKFCRGGQRVEANHSSGFQPGKRCGSGAAQCR
jgi:sugar/nucleoside kinase (ribokinase family)